MQAFFLLSIILVSLPYFSHHLAFDFTESNYILLTIISSYANVKISSFTPKVTGSQ